MCSIICIDCEGAGALGSQCWCFLHGFSFVLGEATVREIIF